MFAARNGTFRHGIELHEKRTGKRLAQGHSAIFGHLTRQMDQLIAGWNTKLEIATRDAENQERLKRGREFEQKVNANRDLRERLLFERSIGPRPLSTPPDAHSDAAPRSSHFNWRELEIRFQEVQAKAPAQKSVCATVIRTEWNSGAVSEEWIISGDLALQKEFECLAAIAAQKLGYVPSDHAHKDWLGRLREWMERTGLDKDRKRAWLPTGSVNIDGTVGTTMGLHSEKIAELSAKFCMYLIARGIPESTIANRAETLEIGQLESKPAHVARKVPKTRKRLQRMAAIFGAIQSKLEGQKYCAALDDRRVPLPDRWREEGCPNTYVVAYRDPAWRKRIQDEKHRHRKLYDQTPAQEREAIIQGETPTRGTRH